MAYAVAYPVTRPAAYAAGNASLGSSGPSIGLSNSSFPENSALNTVIGALSVSGGTGVYTYSFQSNPGTLFNISGSSLRVTSTTIAAGSYPVTVRANNGAGSIIDKVFLLTATAVAGPVALKADFSDANANEAWGFW